MDDIVGLIGAIGLFGWIPIAVFFKHKIRLEELKLHRRAGDDNTLQTLQELRREVQELRETSTKFDMSFDASLSRLEDRMERVEERQSSASASSSDSATVSVGRKI